MTPRAFQLPQPPSRVSRARFGDAELETAALEAADLAGLARRLVAPPGDVHSRAASVARAAQRFVDRADPLCQLAMEWLPSTTGFSLAMIEETLPRIFAPIAEDALVDIVGAAGAPFVASLAIVAAGNVPGVALPKTALALAAGVPCLVKTASGEPILPVLFARAIVEEEPRFAESHAALWWDGGRTDLANALGASVASVVAYGSDATIEALRKIAPPEFVGHGHRLSIAAIRLEVGTAAVDLAAAIARDVALYDQQGCLSAQALFVIGEPEAAAVELVDALAAALDELSVRLPRGHMTDGDHLAIRRFRDEAEWRAIRGERVALRHDSRGTAWTVVFDPEPALRASPLGRTIVVHPLGSAADLGPVLAPLAGRIESIGVAPWPDEELRQVAADLGIPRAVPLGAMQTPDLAWRQGGRDPLAGIVVAEQAPSS